jgi:hypothetical protein
MAKVYLVTIDTTGRQNARSFRPGIQNFYFVYANDGKMAEQMVLASFRARPDLLAQLVPCVKATPLDAITKLLNERDNSWSYVPIAGTRAPGQQGIVPVANPEDPQYARMADKDYVPPRPNTYQAQNDTVIDPRSAGQIDEASAALLNKNTVAPTAGGIPGLDLNNPAIAGALLALLQKAAGGNAGIPATPSLPGVLPNEPIAENFIPPRTLRQDEIDAETAARIRSNIKPSGNVDVDENLQEIDRPVVGRGTPKVNEWGEPIEIPRE